MNQKKSFGFGGLKQLFQFCLALVVTALLINASGIHQWAQRLEIGNEYVPRQSLVELSGAWVSMVEHTGLNHLRRSVMAYRDAREQNSGSNSEDIAADRKSSEGYKSVDDTISAKLNNSESNPSSKPSADLQTKAEGNQVQEGRPVADAQLPTAIAGVSSETYIALVGDSMMAVGLAPNLTRMIEKNSLGKVVRAYKSGTGLARPDVFNWLNEYPKMVAGKNPGIIICAIGANDGQGIEVNKKAFQFGTPAWDEEYARRVGAFSELLLKSGAKVYWVLLPHMRSPVYDQRMQNLNNFLQAKFKDVPNLVFVSPDSMIVGRPVNVYVEYAQINGKQEKLRGEDGIHLSDVGGRNLAAGILKALQ